MRVWRACVARVLGARVWHAWPAKHTHTLSLTQTHTRATARVREKLVFRTFRTSQESAITGISKFKGWPIGVLMYLCMYEVIYLGPKPMKLKKSNGVSKCMISTLKFQIVPLG